MLRSIIKLITPFHGALLHLVLIGIPARFGILPTGLFHKSLGLASPCSMFERPEGSSLSDECSPLENFAIREFGYRFVIHYELALVACFVIKSVGHDAEQKDIEFRKFNLTLATTSMITLLVYSFLQNVGDGPLEQHLFTRTVLYRVLGVMVSLQASLPGPELKRSPTAAWSIPGGAILIGAAVHVLIIIASLQTLLSEEGPGKYFVLGEAGNNEITPIVRTSFMLGIMHTVVNSILLLSLREFMSWEQLQAICGYKAIVNFLLPFFWFPENSGFININVLGAAVFRTFLICVYGMGYLFAGKLDSIGRILRGEKED